MAVADREIAIADCAAKPPLVSIAIESASKPYRMAETPLSPAADLPGKG